jgi:sterol desaturase/sphingolipid hydroxylase (fatty acid hydroxylase superfamily)
MKDYLRNERARMFESDFFEFFSKVHPVVPFVFYVPIAVGLLGWSLYSGLSTPLMGVCFLPLGWLTWQLMEYFLHKSLFHWEGNGPFTRKIHDILHGYHHKYPDDDSRLVMPLSASIPLALAIGGGLYLVGRPGATLPYFVGIVLGYLWYDFTHWSTHYRKPLTAWGKSVRSHHMAHHFNDPQKNFGISHKWIDAVLGTTRVRDADAKE